MTSSRMVITLSSGTVMTSYSTTSCPTHFLLQSSIERGACGLQGSTHNVFNVLVPGQLQLCHSLGRRESERKKGYTPSQLRDTPLNYIINLHQWWPQANVCTCSLRRRPLMAWKSFCRRGTLDPPSSPIILIAGSSSRWWMAALTRSSSTTSA